MDYILLYSTQTSSNNLAYQKTLICNIYPTIMTKVNVSATVGMSATVGEMSATVGKCCNSGGNVRDSGGNVCNSGEIEYALKKIKTRDCHSQCCIDYF